MKTIILSILFIPFIAFSQTKDLSKNEAYTAFKNSNIRKELGFKLKDFNYDLLKRKSKQYNVDLKNMVILSKTENKEFLRSTSFDYARRKNKDAAYCIFCKDIPFYDINKKNFEERDNNTPYK